MDGIFIIRGMDSLLRFQNLSAMPGVVHGISDRRMVGNISFEHGKLNDVLCARDELLGAMNEGNKGSKGTKKLATLVSSRQTHSDHVFVYRDGPAGNGADGEIDDVDAFVTDVPGIGLMVKTADCQPILMAGEKKEGRSQKTEGGRENRGPGNRVKSPVVISVVHSGWRGSLKNIAGKTVQKMVEAFGVDPETIEAGVGPSIGPCCAVFEDESVLTKEALRYRVKGPKGASTHRFDFWAMTRDQLLAEGVRDEAMEFCGICTMCHKDRWFSFRGDKPDVGRFGSVVGLNLVSQALPLNLNT